jgi:hypothetical protein
LYSLSLSFVCCHAIGRGWNGGSFKCGQQSLEVFCAGIFLSFAAHVVLVEISGAIWMQIVVSIIGILMMTVLAHYRSWSKNADKAPAKIKPIVAAAG